MSVRRGADGAFAFWDGLVRASRHSAAMAIDTLLVVGFPPTPIGASPDVRVPLIVNTHSGRRFRTAASRGRR